MVYRDLIESAFFPSFLIRIASLLIPLVPKEQVLKLGNREADTAIDALWNFSHVMRYHIRASLGVKEEMAICCLGEVHLRFERAQDACKQESASRLHGRAHESNVTQISRPIIGKCLDAASCGSIVAIRIRARG